MAPFSKENSKTEIFRRKLRLKFPPKEPMKEKFRKNNLKAEENYNLKMGQPMREIGKRISHMVREFTFLQMEPYILVNLSMDSNPEKESMNLLMVLSMMVTFSKVNFMEKVWWSLLMEDNTMVTGNKEKFTDLEPWHTICQWSTWAILLMEREKVMEHTTMVMAVLGKANGIEMYNLERVNTMMEREKW